MSRPGRRMSTTPCSLSASVTPFGSKVQSLPPPCVCDGNDKCAQGMFKVASPASKTRKTTSGTTISKKSSDGTPTTRRKTTSSSDSTSHVRPSPVATRNYNELMEDVYTALREQYGSHLPQTREFQRFFSPASFTAMRNAVFLQSGGFYPADEDLVQKMIVEYTNNPAVAYDPTEPCRENVPPKMADAHVRMLMQRVVTELGYEVKEANKLWDFYAENLNRPSDIPDTPLDCRCKTGADAATHGDWFMDDKY